MVAPNHGNNSEVLNKSRLLDRFFLNLERFAYTHSITVILVSLLIAGLSIWVTAEKQKIKSATFFWIGSEAEINGYRPSTYKEYDPSYSFSSRVDSVISWFKRPLKNRPRLVMLYFSEPDYTGHKYGPDSKQVDKAIKDTDKILGYLVKSLDGLSIKDSINLVVLSDHGMANSGPEKLIVLDDYIDTSPYNFWMKGSIMSIDMKEDEQSISLSGLNLLSLVPHVSLYTSKTIPHSYHFYNSSFPDVLLVADEGYYVSPEKKPYDAMGMHGYDPTLRSMKTIFIARGPNIKKNYRIDEFENIHMYPFFCKLLGVEPNTSVDGGADGSIEILQNIIKK